MTSTLNANADQRHGFEDRPSSESAARLAAIDKVQAVIEFEMDGTIITANDNFLNTLGYTLEEIRGKHHSMFVDDAFGQSAAYKEFWAKLKRGEHESKQYRRIGKGGKVVWIQASYNPMFNEENKPYKVVKFATDITEQRQLKERAERLAGALQGSATASMQIDADLVLTYANPATLALVESNLATFQRVFPNIDFGNLIGTCIDVFHKNPAHQRQLLGDPSNLPYQAEIAVGELKFALNISAMRDAEGNHICANLEWQDVTAARADQAQQALSNEEIGKLVEAAEAGDLTSRADTAMLAGEFETLVSGVNNILETIDGALGQVNDVAVQVAGASSQINEGSQKLAEGASSQAGSIEEISASLEQTTSMTKQNADNAAEAKSLSNTARNSADKGNETMVDLQQAMQAIKASSEETAKIVKTIDEISFQTNMLALNAAVEAARAGDAGRGFAVVAEEVRSLAQRSAEAAKSTAELIESATRNADTGVSIAEQVQSMLGEITDGSTKVNDLITEIAAASKEQADGLSQVSTAVDQVNKVTQENSATSEESSAAASQLNGQVDQLSEMIGKFVLSSNGSAPAAQASPPVRPEPRRRPSALKKRPAPQRVIPLDDDELRDF